MSQDAQPPLNVEPLVDHTRGYLIRKLIRGEFRYLRVRDEADEMLRSDDYV
jgi:hypothetical protein